MPVYHVLALPIPQGLVNGKPRLSVYFAHRLRENGSIDQYPDVANWPSRLNNVSRYWVNTNKGRFQASRVSVTPNQTVWNAVFSGAAARRVTAYPFVERDIDRLTSVTTHRMNDLAEQILRRAVLSNRTSMTKQEVIDRFPGLVNVSNGIAPYFGKVGNDTTPSEASIDQDWHGSVRQLGAHPDLMRRLGLVLDLELSQVPPSDTTEVSLEMEFRNGRTLSGGVVALRMKLARGFLPVSDVKGYANDRFLILGSSAFQVSQIDPSHVAGQLADMAAVVADRDAPADAVIDLPAFTDGGISVVHPGARSRMRGRFESGDSMEQKVDAHILDPAGKKAPLITYADVVAGLRLDVRRGTATTSPWRSVHRRRSPDGYEFPSNASLKVAPPQDEGWVSQATSTDGTPRLDPKRVNIRYGEVRKKVLVDNTRVRLSDQLVVWNGWSLSTPKPSKSTTGSGDVEGRGKDQPNSEYPGKVSIDYKPVKGSLPSLRYGQSYTLRARMTDITGGGPSLSTANPSGTNSRLVTYGRFAPVAAPSVLRRVSRPDPGVGDEPTTLVIRSNLGQATNAINPTDRLLFPPSVPQSVVERHGLPGDGTDPSAYADLADRDSRSINDQVIIDPDTNEPVAGAALVSGAVTLGGLEQQIKYLADPMAAGVAGLFLPGQTGAVSVPYGTWPTYETPRLQLAAGTGAPVVDANTKTITVKLPPGTTHTCRVSHTPAASRITHMKGVQLLDKAGHQAHDLEILRGWNEAITNSREITLVHAVRQPTVPPNFPSALSIERPSNAIGETRAALSGTIGVHGQTSDHVALSAAWSDPVDDLAFDAPSTVSGVAYVGDVLVEETDTQVVLDDLTFDLDDTRRRTLTVSSEAFCRYSRYFTERRRVEAVAGATTVLDAAGISGTDIEVRNRNTDRVFVKDIDYTVDPGAGSVTIVNGGGIPVGAPLEIRYLRRPFTRLSADAESQQTALVLLPSSVAPAPPVVRTVVPAFHRPDATVTSTTVSVVNDGRVVRVLLERPWYSSGEEEKLAVVLDSTGVGGVGTVWGRDPIIGPPGATVQPVLADFPFASATATDVDGVTTIDAAAHDVSYDASRNIWVCDVLVDADFSYRPFVQLAVARYQGEAVPGAHMSGIVGCVPTRLGVRREVTVTKTATNVATVTVTGPDSGANTMRVILQRRVVSSGDELFNWVDVREATMTRTGTAAAATFTVAGFNTTAATLRRLVIEESEPVNVQSGASTTASSMVAFREVVLLPGSF